MISPVKKKLPSELENAENSSSVKPKKKYLFHEKASHIENQI